MKYATTKSSEVPIGRRLGGPQNLSGRYGEEKKIVPAGLFNEVERKIIVGPLQCDICNMINFATLVFCMQQINIKTKEASKSSKGAQ
jgi:hypothetical protein